MKTRVTSVLNVFPGLWTIMRDGPSYVIEKSGRIESLNGSMRDYRSGPRLTLRRVVISGIYQISNSRLSPTFSLFFHFT